MDRDSIRKAESIDSQLRGLERAIVQVGDEAGPRSGLVSIDSGATEITVAGRTYGIIDTAMLGVVRQAVRDEIDRRCRNLRDSLRALGVDVDDTPRPEPEPMPVEA